MLNVAQARDGIERSVEMHPRLHLDAQGLDGRDWAGAARAAQYPPELTSALEGGHLPVLDGLRALAALSVVIYHLDEKTFPIGGDGVLAFFVISGFLITWLMCAEAERTGGISLRRFYVRRALRLFPAFYVYWILATAFLVVAGYRVGRAVPWSQGSAALLYVCNYYQGLNHYPSSLYSHTWSLAVEEQFYLVWPALFLVLVKLPVRVRALVVALLVLLFWGLRSALHTFVAPEEYVYTAFECRADQLLVGCLLAVTLRAGLAGPVVRVLVRIPASVTLLAFAASFTCELRMGVDYRNIASFSLEPILVAMLIVRLMSTRHRLSVRWLESRPLRFLGGISYSIYLYQQIVLHLVPHALPGGLPMALKLPINVAAVVAVAYASYLLVETPFNQLKARYLAQSA